jgi:hypothetical protein
MLQIFTFITEISYANNAMMKCLTVRLHKNTSRLWIFQRLRAWIIVPVCNKACWVVQKDGLIIAWGIEKTNRQLIVIFIVEKLRIDYNYSVLQGSSRILNLQ